MNQFFGSLLFSLFVTSLFVGAWAWVLVLFKKGIMGLLGFDRIIVQQFENVLIYNNGSFERSLLQGVHWIRARNRQLIRIDLRPEVYRLTQGVISSDHFAVNVLYVARAQITNSRTSFETTKNYSDEIVVRLQSVVKRVCGEKSRMQIQTDHQGFDESARQAASLALRDIGCECVTFELLQAEPTGAVAELDDRRVGFGPH
jgi:regulator of protease activity HflC (stomatin/prohibitin superfamily)